jgi:hypothetical protein
MDKIDGFTPRINMLGIAHKLFIAVAKRVLTVLFKKILSSSIDLSIAKIMRKLKSINQSKMVCGHCPPYWLIIQSLGTHKGHPQYGSVKS